MASAIIISHQPLPSELRPRYRTSCETESTANFTAAKPKSTFRAKFSFGFSSQSSLSTRSDTHSYDAQSFTSRSSIDSVSTLTSTRSLVDFKLRKIPPPLQLKHSNFHPKDSRGAPVIEIIVSSSPRVESRLPSYSVDPASPAPPTPITPTPVTPTPVTPAFEMPSEKEMRRRRYEKVMRTLGERVPAELVCRGPNIPPTTVIPETRSKHKHDNEFAPGEAARTKLKKQGSFSRSLLPNLPSVTASLLSTNHGHSKSRGLLGFSDTSPTGKPTPLAFLRQAPPVQVTAPSGNFYHTQSRPPSVYVDSPTSFATALETTTTFGTFHSPTTVEGEDYRFWLLDSQRKEAARAAKLSRRASLSTATFLPTSPMRDGFRDLHPHTPRSRRSRQRHRALLELDAPIDVELEMDTSLCSSTTMSPLVFEKRASLVPPPSPGFNLAEYVEYHDGPELGEASDGGEYDKLQSQSESGHGQWAGPADKSHPHSTPHPPYQLCMDTPFQDRVVPTLGYFAPQGSGKDLLRRKESRQGWSGEWNQDDMQEVIQKLRTLR